ncbi:dTDP-4-dehydrorhamnose 3,5-epimerase [Gemmatimonadetes bacterium T265]|nr:dTDP-4-dehydrorhamnose 3,5-epimerase [Gemmatimonadetes bacterium T265]
MRIRETSLPGVLLLDPSIHHDARGAFVELAHLERFAATNAHDAHGLPEQITQINLSRSAPGVLRGLHWQSRRPQGKLISTVRGAVFDVAVDVRRGSPMFGRWTGATLDAASGRQLWIPAGFAHGFCVLSDDGADLVYACTTAYDAASDTGVRWDDPSIGVEWPLGEACPGGAPLLSPRDAVLPPLDPARADLPAYEEFTAAIAA